MATVLSSETTEIKEALPIHTPWSRPRYSFSQRLRSSYHALWYRLGEGLKWSRGLYRETPVEHLTQFSGKRLARIVVLQRRFDIRFEQQYSAVTAIKNYDYLDILDQAWTFWGKPRPVGGLMHDVGSSNFWYARALHAFFAPDALTGVEMEGYRIYSNGYSRWDYAQGYVADLPRTSFKVIDYTHYADRAETIITWFPFVSATPVLAWRMPLCALSPHALFRRVADNLRPAGLFVMINQGREEASIAFDLCRRVDLVFEGSCEVQPTVRPRRILPVVSWWRHR
jgi:hypothetical protein